MDGVKKKVEEKTKEEDASVVLENKRREPRVLIHKQFEIAFDDATEETSEIEETELKLEGSFRKKRRRRKREKKEKIVIAE